MALQLNLKVFCEYPNDKDASDQIEMDMDSG